MDIKPKERQIREILGAKKQYEIPRFQRDYSWEKRNYREFLCDIIGNLIISGSKVASSPYFMGTMLFVGDSEDENQRVVQVVDGQQRLTTITILFSALARIFNEKNEPKLSKRVFDYVMAEDDNGDEVRIIKTMSSYPYFSFFIQSLNQEHAKSPNTEEEQCIAQTYEYFLDQLSENKLRKICKEQKLAASGVDYIDLLKAIRDQILDSTVVEIYTKDNKLANKLFEILNAKGKQLAHIDLIKNKIFEKLDSTEPADFAQETWKEIVSTLNDGTERTGVATFYRHFWASCYGRATSSKLYESFNKSIKPDQYESFLTQLATESKVYKKITNPRREDYQNKKQHFWLVNSLKAFNEVFNVIQIRVPLLALYAVKEKGILKEKRFKEVVVYLENFHFAYNAILALRPNSIDPIYTKFAVSLRKCTTATDVNNVIQNNLIKQLDALYPQYSDFESKFIELAYSKTDLPSNMKAKYVIYKLFCYYDEKDVPDDSGTIEHIIPDNDDMSQNIGNLILLEQGINNDSGDKTFFDKVQNYKRSSYKWVKDFINIHSSWDSSDIPARAKELAKTYYTKVMGRQYGQ